MECVSQHTAAADAASHVSTCGPASFNVFVDKGLSSPANRGSQARDDLDTVAFSHAHHLDLHHQLTSVRPPLSSLPLDQLEDSSISQGKQSKSNLFNFCAFSTLQLQYRNYDAHKNVLFILKGSVVDKCAYKNGSETIKGGHCC